MYADIKFTDGTTKHTLIPPEALEIYRDNTLNAYSNEVYEARNKKAEEYILENTDKPLEKFDLKPERADITQYLLDQGVSITYNPNNAETTSKEQNGTNITRYVLSEQIDFFEENEAYVKDSARYAVISDMAMLDFDEWNALAQAFQMQLSYDEAFGINTVLWTEHDLSALDIPINEEAKTIKEAIGLDDLSPKTEQYIYKVLSKRDDFKLDMSNECKKSLQKNDRADDR